MARAKTTQTAAVKDAPVAPTKVAAKTDSKVSYNQMQVLVGEMDALNVAHDETGRLISGDYLSAKTFVNEVNRLVKDGWQVGDISTYGGIGTTGLTAGRVNMKVVFQKGELSDHRRQERFGMLLMPEDNANAAQWKQGTEFFGMDGFELYKVVPLGVQQQSSNTLYLFVKYATK